MLAKLFQSENCWVNVHIAGTHYKHRFVPSNVASPPPVDPKHTCTSDCSVQRLIFPPSHKYRTAHSSGSNSIWATGSTHTHTPKGERHRLHSSEGRAPAAYYHLNCSIISSLLWCQCMVDFVLATLVSRVKDWIWLTNIFCLFFGHRC